MRKVFVQKPLSNEILFKWHEMLFKDIRESGQYRTHPERMQIVSNRLDVPKVFFEAPPSDRVPKEMDAFIDWFNTIDQKSSVLGQAAIAHVYFESIHPFELISLGALLKTGELRYTRYWLNLK